MATARITQTFDDGGAIQVEVVVDHSYPDVVAEAVTEVLRLWREAVPDDAVGE